MVNFWEVVERCDKGERMNESEYDLMLFQAAKDLVKKYDIYFDQDQVVPEDDDLADRAFEAGLELFLKVGFYCLDTKRIVRFTREEIKEVLTHAPSSYTWGTGRDQRVCVARKVEDSSDPSFIFSGLGVPVPEDQFLQVNQALAAEPHADAFCGVSLDSTFRGIPLRSGHPIEVAAGIFDVTKRREAARLVGRPGLGLYCFVSAAEASDAIIASSCWALNRDSTQNGAIAEMKVDFARMNKVAYQLEKGLGIGALFGPLMGGYAGGPEGTMLVQIAHFFLGLTAFQAEYGICFPIDLHQVCNSSSEMLWLSSVYSQAISRNTHLLNLSVAMASAGPASEMLFYEFVAYAMTASVSGASGIVTGGIARDKYPERVSTLEMRASAEAAHIVARSGMSRSDVNKVVKKIAAIYEKDIPNAPLGKKFREIYDMERVTPLPEYVEVLQKIRNNLAELGLDYSVL
jgi:methylamine---corrinoid protein Co-methyltransferase